MASLVSPIIEHPDELEMMKSDLYILEFRGAVGGKGGGNSAGTS